MASIIPGFEYDIFISYRHNDNQDGWVTDFVQNLEKELRGTLKDTVTIYFDQNPHDGLLETHNVDKSLEGKLKCLIFIPIISQTYCDPKSFAWQHEFVAFNKMAIEGIPHSSGEGPGVRSFKRDIKLINGNVASRILPVKIHDLDAEDKATIENEIGGVLRAIEFIYKEAGVNRPLKSTDSKSENQNKTDYRNQVNKVANAIKEIITSLKNPSAQPARASINHQPTAKANRKPLIAILSLILLLAVAGFFLYPKLLRETLPTITLDKSIAVLPFVDLSEAKDQGWFSDGLTEEILNSLAHVKGLSVISRTSSFAFKDKNLRIQTIADSLNVNYVVEGSVRKSENGLRITAQLIRAKDGFHIWSNTYDRKPKDIFALQQEIAAKIAESLDISLDPKAVEKMQWAGTNNPEAFVDFLKGQAIFTEAHERKRSELLPYLKRANLDFDDAIRLDQDFINPYLYSGDFYFHYLTKNEKTVYNDTITEVEAYQLMRGSIISAIDKSKSEIAKDYYKIYSIMYSNDWSSIRPVIERVLKSPEAVQLFSYQPYNVSALLSILGYGDQIAANSRAILTKDPLNSNRKREVVEASMFSGDYSRAIERIDSLNTLNDDGRLNHNKLFCLYQLKKFDEAYSLLMQLDSGSVASYHSLLAMLLAQKGKLKEAKQIMDNDMRIDYSLFGIEAAYGRDAANREAAQLDKNLVLHPLLLFGYLHAPSNLPFDLSVTPNFVKRLRQAGVDLKVK